MAASLDWTHQRLAMLGCRGIEAMLSEEQARSIVAHHMAATVAGSVPGGYDDPGRSEVFYMEEADLDGDGLPEVCLVGGIPSVMSAASALLVVRTRKIPPPPSSSDQGNFEIIPLVPLGYGWQGLRVEDLDQDNRLEIWSTWVAGSGGFLDVLIHRYSGTTQELVLEHRHAYQGAVERKNFDGRPVDDIIVWESVGDSQDGPWLRPHRYILTVHRWTRGVWTPASINVTHNSYMPGQVGSRRSGPMNLPAAMGQHLVSRRDDVRMLGEATTSQQLQAAARQVMERIETYVDQHDINEALYRNALVAELLPQLTQENPLWGAHVLAQQGFLKAQAGNLPEARQAFADARNYIEHRSDLHALRSSYLRSEGMLAALMGDFETALLRLRTARDLIPLLHRNSPQDAARENVILLSNMGLAHYWAGDSSAAIPFFNEAVAKEKEGGNPDGAALNLTFLGNVERTAGRYDEALKLYNDALDVLALEPDRDREANILAERSMLYSRLNRPADALQDARAAVLLADSENLAISGGIHQIVYAEALAECGLTTLAYAAAVNCAGVADRWANTDLSWRASLLAAQTCPPEHESDQRRWLLKAERAVEALRSQTLPEPVRIALAAGRERVYCALVKADLRAGDAASAFRHMEAAKSRVLAELLARAPLPSPPVEPALLAREAAALQNLASLESSTLSAIEGLGGAAPSAHIVSARESLNAVWDDIAAANPTSSEYVSLRRASPATLNEILESLSP